MLGLDLYPSVHLEPNEEDHACRPRRAVELLEVARHRDQRLSMIVAMMMMMMMMMMMKKKTKKMMMVYDAVVLALWEFEFDVAVGRKTLHQVYLFSKVPSSLLLVSPNLVRRSNLLQVASKTPLWETRLNAQLHLENIRVLCRTVPWTRQCVQRQ